ncbi:MAG: alpha-N-arabinofuranosidase, partial [Lachnospiraceae bacterium]|nr:alpha-N-arabinofuranosidase [Lachnospiraceae bacterium]
CTAAPHSENCHGFMDGLSLHYYVVPETWQKKGSATEFDEKDWYKTLAKATFMEELITRHGAIMDQYDPEKKIGMMVDEWGCWFDVEPGTNPGFLYQQNTMRDALVAGLTLNIFNKHCDRVKMACIAQLVNVLQSVILTEGPKMILTPTYYIFHMYKHHQNAELVESFVEDNRLIGIDEKNQVPQISESVSVSADGTVNITVGNLSVTDAVPLELSFAELTPAHIEAAILTGEMCAHNTFNEPESVKEAVFTDFKAEDGKVVLTVPACSVISFRIK